MTGARDKRDTGGRAQGVRNIPGEGPLKALANFKALGRGVVAKEQLSRDLDTNYFSEESKIFALNNEVTSLIEELNSRETKE